MASTINATTSGVVTTGDSVATLSLQTGGTTAVAIDTAQIVTLSKSLALLGSSSGSVSIAAPAVAGSTTLTLPATSGTLLQSGTAVTVAQGGTGQTSYTDGQLLIGNSTGNTLSKATLTAGTNVTITNGNGSITIAASGGGASAATPTALGTVYGKTPNTGQILAIGYNAGLNSTTDSIIAIGNGALQSSAGIADQNLAIGYQALTNHTSNGINIAIGHQSLSTSTAGYYNTGIGFQTLNAITTGNGNVAIGGESGKLITGNDNLAIGRQSNRTGTTGNNNISLGSAISVSSATVSNEITIGAGITGKGANTGYINANGGGVYQGNNATTWSITSDRRLKKNIVENNVGLDAIKSIQVKNFEYRLPEEVEELDANCAIDKKGIQLGVIAQEIQAVLPDCVKQESTGVLGLQSDNLTWYMVNAIKQLSAALDAANARIAALEAK